MSTLIVLGVLANVAMQVYLSPVVEHYTRKEIYEASQGRYIVDSMEVEWGIFNSSLSINNFSLRSDSAKWNTTSNDSLSSPKVDLFIPRIEVERFNMLGLYQENLLKAAALKISKPIVYVEQDGGKQKQDSLSLSWKQWIPPSIQSMDIDQVRIEEGSLEFKNLRDSSDYLMGIKHLNILIDEVKFDSTTLEKESPLSFAHDIHVSGDLTDYPFFSDEYLHQLRLGDLEFRANEKKISLKNIQLTPIFPQVALDSLVPVSVDANIPEIQLLGIDLEAFLQLNELSFHKLHIQNPKIQHSFSPIPQSDSIQDFVLSPLLYKFRLDSLVVKNGVYANHENLSDSMPIVSLRGIDLNMDKISLGHDHKISTREVVSIIKSLDTRIDTAKLRLNKADYEVFCQDLQFRSDSGDIELSQIQFFPLKNREKTQIHSEIPNIVVKGIDIHSLITNRVLLANILQIRKPQLDLYQYWPSADSQLIARWRDFDGYHLIRNVLNELKVNILQIDQGRLSVFQPQAQNQSAFQAKDISINIQQFTVGPYTHHLMEAPFYASDLDLDFNIEGSAFILPDSSYSLAVSGISFSTQDSTLAADSILLLPLYPDSSSYRSQNAKVFLGIPHVQLKGLDFYRAYFQREVSLDSMWINEPKIQLKSPQSANFSYTSLSTFLDSLNLYQIISPFIEKFEVNYFEFEKADISRETTLAGEIDNYFYPHISISLNHFFVDSTNQMMGNRFLFSEDLELKLGSIDYWLPDSLHQFSIQTITYTTSDQHVAVDTIRLKPNIKLSDENQQNLYEVTIPQVRINGLELMEVYQEKHLSLSDVQVFNPIVSMVNHPEIVREEMDSLSQANLYDLISDYLHYLDIENLVVREGEVVLKNWNQKQENAFHADDLFVFIKDFRIDSTSWANPSNRFYAKDIDIGMDANNYSFTLPDSTYLLQIGTIGMSTEDSLLSAQKVTLVPLENRLRERKSDLLWQIEIPHFQIKGFEPAQWYFHQIARLQHVRILQPNIRMEHLRPATVVEHDPMKVYNFISQHFQDLYIKDLFVEGASFEEVRLPADTIKPISINGLSLRAMNVSPDSSDFLSPDHLFYSNDVRISIKDYEVDLPELAYEIEFGELGMHTASDQVYAKDLYISPKMGIKEFFQSHGFARDYVDCRIPDVKVEGVDLDALIHDQDFKANRLLLQGLHIDAKKDRSYPENPNKRPPMLHDIIRNLPFYLKLDTMSVANGSINFVQHVPNLKKDARFYMDDLHANLYNLTNDSLLLVMGVEAILEADSRLMETGNVSVKFTIPLADTTNRYTFSGEVGRMNFTEFNPILEQTAFVFVTDGTIQNGFFEVNAFPRLRKRKWEYLYKGKMRLRYSDLKLAVIDKKTMFEKEEYDEKKMASFLANTFVRSNNPKGRGRFLRVGKIYYEKEDHKAMIGHWVQALVSGIRSSVGLENKDERERIILPSFGKKAEKRRKK